MKEPAILITGANGQIGTVLTRRLQERHGIERVLATDIRKGNSPSPRFEILDALDTRALEECIQSYGITEVYHLAAILSAKGESDPLTSWRINMNSLFNVLEVARSRDLKVFFPSSIAVFGPNSPEEKTPQDTVMHPTTVYGISKVAGELWAQYYHQKFGVDVRSVRYPGIIGYESLPGGGTTDYAVEIYHQAVKKEPFTCFLNADTRLPMLYMPDAIRATIELMKAPKEQIRVRTSYNLAGMTFSPSEVVEAIRDFYPHFKVDYKPDFRQEIADSWSSSIDDSQARRDWGWQPEFDLPAMTKDMIEHLRLQYVQQA